MKSATLEVNLVAPNCLPSPPPPPLRLLFASFFVPMQGYLEVVELDVLFAGVCLK